MKPLLSFGAFLLTGSLAVAVEPSASPSPQQSTPEAVKAADLVRQLADTNFNVRETAARQLKKLGRHAKIALAEGTKSADPEVWNRCVQLLPDALALDLQARVDAYLADTEGKQKHSLPLMDRFQKIAGNDAGARKFYADLVKTNALFLDACESQPAQAAEIYNTRANELYHQAFGDRMGRVRNPINVSVNDLAALFLAGADSDMRKDVANKGNPASNFIYQMPFQNALRAGEQSAALRKVFFAWAENRDDLNTISQTIGVIQSLNMKEGIEFAVKVMNKKDQQIWARAQAITCVGKIGGKEQLPAFEALFDDKTLVGNYQWQNVAIKTQVNDIALAMAVQHSEQKHKDYGFDVLQSQPALLWSYNFAGFSTDEKRADAFKKYQDWKAAQKK